VSDVPPLKAPLRPSRRPSKTTSLHATVDHHAATRDYLRLIGEGSVIRDTDDTDGWRKAIRARARADRLRVGVSRQMPSRAWAALLDSPPPTPDEMRNAAAKLDAYLVGLGR
jgi:hypothetical protein